MKTERSNTGALVGGTLLVAFGLLALAQQVFRDFFTWSLIWPASVIVLGGLFFAGMFAGGKQVSGLAIPGTIIGGIGLVLLYQNLTGHWESWAYAWALIVFFVGLGVYLMGLYAGDEGQRRAGGRVMRTGFTLFVIFGAFFEMLFSTAHVAGLRNFVFPALLILFGIYLILGRMGLFGPRRASEPKSETPAPPTPPAPPQEP
jgi:hypothetical protein